MTDQISEDRLAEIYAMCWNGSLFLPPPGVDPYDAYAQVFSGCFAIWIVAAMIGLAW